MDTSRQTLSVLVMNEPGVLSQVARFFSRKGFNISSLAVGTTEDPTISRITIEIFASDPHTELISNQLRKLYSVISVKRLDPEHSIRRELVLIKVKAEDAPSRNEITQIAGMFRASIIDVSLESLTLSVIGTEGKVDAMVKMLEQHGIMELLRTGIIAIERGNYTITEETKERGEFDYGKNVL